MATRTAANGAAKRAGRGAQDIALYPTSRRANTCSFGQNVCARRPRARDECGIIRPLTPKGRVDKFSADEGGEYRRGAAAQPQGDYGRPTVALTPEPPSHPRQRKELNRQA
jgi:hypothetical protein